ncbi:MAG TPA: hypothetical protein VMU82_09785, partial [Acetobacteraceae bacterium]|nr:hypothetical protein [Acetobacteraceae bacterium]
PPISLRPPHSAAISAETSKSSGPTRMRAIGLEQYQLEWNRGAIRELMKLLANNVLECFHHG